MSDHKAYADFRVAFIAEIIVKRKYIGRTYSESPQRNPSAYATTGTESFT